MGSQVVIGPGRRAAYASAAVPWPGDAVSRITLRTMATPAAGDVSGAFKRWLRVTESRGHIKRGELFIFVRHREALLHNATDGIRTWGHRDFLDPEDAIARVTNHLPSEQDQGLRARLRVELGTIENWSKNW